MNLHLNPRCLENIDNIPSIDLMRSEKMTFIQLIILVESAHHAITYLSQLGLLPTPWCTHLSLKNLFFFLSFIFDSWLILWLYDFEMSLFWHDWLAWFWLKFLIFESDFGYGRGSVTVNCWLLEWYQECVVLSDFGYGRDNITRKCFFEWFWLW